MFSSPNERKRNQGSLLLGLAILLSISPVDAWQATKPAVQEVADTRKFDPSTLEKLTRALAPKIVAATVGIVSTEEDVNEQGVGTGGSGVIVSEEGLILTAAHVIAGGTDDVLVLLGKRKIPAKIVGYMGRGDFGVIQLKPEKAEKWPFLPMAKVEKVAPGTPCVGAGHTARIDPARPAPVRFGRVLGERVGESFVDELGDRAELEHVLVSDAPFLPGDSGGPLVNLQGEVIGVHSSIGPDHRENLHIPIWQFHKHWPKLMAGVKRPVPSGSGRHQGKHLHELELPSLGSLNRVPIADFRVSVERSWSRTHRNFLRQFESPLLESSPCVQVFVDDRPVAFGMVIAAAGTIATKASVLTEDKIICRVQDQDHPAKVLVRDEAHDVALLKIEAEKLVPVKWSREKEMLLGTLLISKQPAGTALSLSVVSVKNHVVADASTTEKEKHGFLGVELKTDAPQARISRVLPNTPAKLCGLQVGDELCGINGTTIESGSELIESLRKHKPGDQVKIEYERQGKKHHVEVKLALPPSEQWADALEFATWSHSSGGISQRAAPFPEVFSHDAFITPRQCGGPVFNLNGEVVGMNIARVDRTCTYAIPTATLEPLMAKMLEKTR